MPREMGRLVHLQRRLWNQRHRPRHRQKILHRQRRRRRYLGLRRPGRLTGYFPGNSDVATADAKHWPWIVLKAHPRNKAGTVTLRSADPRDTPIINVNYFDSGTTDDSAGDSDS